MFLSKLSLNLRNSFVRRDLASPYEMHKSLWRAFGEKKWNSTDRPKPPGKPAEMLFRVDTDRFGGNPTAIVQSDSQPEWAKLPENYLTTTDCVSNNLPEFLQRFAQTGQKLRFRLRANPTKRLRGMSIGRDGNPIDPEWVKTKPRLVGGTKSVGPRISLTTEAERIDWLLKKGHYGGFTIAGQWVEAKHPETDKPIRLPNFRVDVIPEGRDHNDKVGHRDGAFGAVRFEGVLEVSDPEKFRATVFAGVGSAKGFGFGLLSVGPA